MTDQFVTLADLDVSSSKHAGATIFWKLRDKSTRLSLDEALHNAGVAKDDRDIPNPPTAEKALRRACKRLREYRRLIRPLKGKKGWALVSEDATEENITHETDVIVKVGVGYNGEPDVVWEPTADGNYRIGYGNLAKMEAEVRAAFDEEFNILNHGDMSAWLLRHVHRMNAITLRDGGGVYFIPGGYIPHWERLGEALKLLGRSRAYSITAIRASNAIEAVFDCLADEATSMAEHVRGKMASETIGVRAMHNRIDTCEAFLEKVKRYEKFLDTNMDRVHEQVGTLKTELAAAILAADEDDEDLAMGVG